MARVLLQVMGEMIKRLLLTCLLLSPLGCADTETVEPTEFIDGERKLTEEGSFAVALWHAEGSPVVGANEFILEVSIPSHDKMPMADVGVAGASVMVDCWMPNAGHEMTVNPMVVPGAPGEYLITHVELDEVGVWQLDFDIAVGDGEIETVSYAFLVE